MQPDELVSTVQAAEIIGRSVPTVKRLAKKGELPFAVKMPGDTGAYLFDRATVEAFAAKDAAA